MSYVDKGLDADFNGALQDLEGLGGESIVIQGRAYPATFGKQIVSQTFGEDGNAREVLSMTATVRRSLFPVMPVLGNKPVAARGLQWRVMDVSPSLSTYELTLQAAKK